MDEASRLRILVLGYLVRRPLGGGTWPFIQYAIGLMRLGHDVYFLEDSEDYPCCYDPTRHVTDEDPTFGLGFAKDALAAHGLGERWAYFDAHTDTWHGPCADRIPELCSTADALVNVSGINPIRPWLEQVPRRAYVDTDPAFQQVRSLDDEDRRRRTLQHNVFFTYGENIPAGRANLPDDGVPWQPCRPPVVLDLWPVTPGPAHAAFTTVMLWDSYVAREHDGFHLGMKSESFESYWDLPSRVDRRLELAVGGPGVPRDRLRQTGWSVINPLEPTKDMSTYQAYLAGSRGEFTVAKHGYVASSCGWFSERSAHYLGSGRPVVTQETGFSDHVPTGSGLLAHTSLDEAVAAIEAIDKDYERHCAAARDVAGAFDSYEVLGSLIARTMDPAPNGMTS